ncbi:ATPase [Rodentibacter caecimuris]|uniref:type IV secretory system conjugative DNA transfer family protein n=1 Tax=Rodentibacter caecimuris TaxID=1796644 RepID=UPI0009C9DCEF|nr:MULTISPECIES: type IV secretory system conjugative DNA transfer family protein [Pasteurellaceae]OOF74506.1 ATPase [Rodentibacter heylii]
MRKKMEIAFIVVIMLLITYFSSGLALFLLNGVKLKVALSRYYPLLPFEALINGYPKVSEAFGIGFCISIIVIGVLFLTQRKKASLYGDAKFATMAEIQKMGLLAKEGGIIVGKIGGKLLRFVGSQFVSLAAPTRGGKGVGVVIPNLLEWEQSAVVQDIKDECYRITSKYRQDKLGQKVYRFAPFERNTDCFNPLDYVDMSDRARAELDLKSQAMGLYPLVGIPDKDFWSEQAQNLFIAVAFLLWDMKSKHLTDWNFTYANLLRLQSGFDGEADENGEIQRVTFEEHAKLCIQANIAHPATVDKLNVYFSACSSSKTKSGIDSTFTTPLMIFQNDIVEKATAHSDFDLRKLRREKITIYFHISPKDLLIAPQIANLFFNMVIVTNVDELPDNNPALKYQPLLLLDEFTAMGMLSIINKSVAYIAGYGLRLLLIYQTQSQLRADKPEGYGVQGAENLLGNIWCKILYAPSEQKDAEEYSKVLGNMTVDKISRNKSKNSNSRGISDTARPLLYPQEFKLIGETKEIVVMNNSKPIMCDKAIYYNDPYFINKLKSVSPVLRNLGKKLPTKAELEKAMFSGELSAKRIH